jgi:hypothetical protein
VCVDDAAAANLADRIEAGRDAYACAEPWPHLVIEDAVPGEVLGGIAGELAAGEGGRMLNRRYRRQIKKETNTLTPSAAAVMAVVESAPVAAALAVLTGIADLTPDPRHTLAGIHVTPTGGFTRIHHDFHRHPHEPGRFHRANVLLYATPGWDAGWGGELELWPPDMAACGARYAPMFNRMVIWETHGDTLHGLPDPLRSPPGTGRIALASYWYSPQPWVAPTTSVTSYHARPQDGRFTTVPSLGEVVRTTWQVLARRR